MTDSTAVGGDVRNDTTGVTLTAAERSIIGWALDAKNAATAENVIDGLLDRHFYLPAHEVIYAHIRAHVGAPDVFNKCLADLIDDKVHQSVKALPGGVYNYMSASLEQAAFLGEEQIRGYRIQVLSAYSARRMAEVNERIAIALSAGDLDAVVGLTDELRQQADQTAEMNPRTSRKRIRLTPASQFKIRGVKWAWENRMAVGALTLIPGREGVGKSTFLAWLSAAFTRGELPGVNHGIPRSVLYSASEDAWEYTIAPRMLAAGADMSRVYRIDAASEEVGHGGLILPRDCREVADAARDVDAGVLLCDPIISLVDERLNSFKSQELRKALEPLTSAAEAAGIAVGALVHFNKGQNSDVGTLISGARAWVEVARSVIAIARDKEAEEYTCVVSQTKNNLGRGDLPNLTYTIDSHQLPTDEGEVTSVGKLRWTGETDRGVEDLLAAGMSGEPSSGGKPGQLMREMIEFVVGKCPTPGQSVSTADLLGEFGDEYKPEAIRQTLSRAVRGNRLWSPMRGLYRPLAHMP